MNESGGFKLIKNSTVYSIMMFLKYSMGFILLPLYTKYLTIESYGIISLVTAIINVGVVIYSLSLETALCKFYYEGKVDFKKYVSSSILAIILFSVITTILLLLVLVSAKASIYIGVSKSIIILTLISMTFQPIYNYYESYLRALQKSKAVSILSLSYFVMQVLLIIIFVTICEMQVVGVLLAYSCTNIFYASISLFFLIRSNGYAFNRKYLKEILKYSMPIIPNNVLAWAYGIMDRFFIANLLTVSAVSLYTIGYQIGSILFIVSGLAVNSAYAPWFLEQIYNDNKGAIIKYSLIVIKLYCIICVFLSFFSMEIIHLIVTSSVYYDSWIFIPLITISFLFNGMYILLMNVFYIKNTSAIIKITFPTFILTCILNYFFLKHFGLLGMCLSLCLIKLVLVLLGYYYAQKEHFISYNIKEIVIYISLTLLISLSVYIFPSEIDGYYILLKIGLYVFLLFLLFVFNKNEIIYIFKTLRQKIKFYCNA